MTFTLLLLFCIGCPALSYLRFRSVLHPHFIFTLSWVYLLPFGAVVSPTIPDFLQETQDTNLAVLGKYHFLIIGLLSALFLTTMFMRESQFRIPKLAARGSMMLNERSARVIGFVGLGILGAEWIKQWCMCNWSLRTWFEYTTGPRFGRPWSGGYMGGSDFILTFIENIYFAAPLILPIAVFRTKGVMRCVTVCGLLLMLGMMAGDGSRTPVALTILMIALLWLLFAPNLAASLTGLLALACFFVILTTIMGSHRNEGLTSVLDSDIPIRELSYHQDDNYYQLISVIKVAENGVTPNWNAFTFLEACVLNPIPRYFWPGKPFLTEDFYGDWKLPYITVSFIGECIAMFGKWMGLACAYLLGLGYYRLLLYASKRIRREFGFVVYLSICFYIYMTERSIHNIGMYAVFVWASIAIYLFIRHFAQTNSTFGPRGRPPIQHGGSRGCSGATQNL